MLKGREEADGGVYNRNVTEVRRGNEARLRNMQKTARYGKMGKVASKGEEHGRGLEKCFTFLYKCMHVDFHANSPLLL
jgi:hypothetical protein